jgi:hypothetical protein
MRRKNQHSRYPRTGIRRIGEILPSVLAQYARPVPVPAESNPPRHESGSRKPRQKFFSFVR